MLGAADREHLSLAFLVVRRKPRFVWLKKEENQAATDINIQSPSVMHKTQNLALAALHAEHLISSVCLLEMMIGESKLLARHTGE